MGIFDIFVKKPLQETTLKVGDWVTQYSTGYWQVVAIYPKFADADYSYGDISWKKGDRLGNWVILKKGFTFKMKPSNACEFLDSKNCQLISSDVVRLIETAFENDPKVKAKFDKAPNLPNPSVYRIFMSMSEECADAFAELISILPKRFTLDEFWKYSDDYRKYVTKPPSYTHVLYLYSYLWEINDDFETLHFNPEIKKR